MPKKSKAQLDREIAEALAGGRLGEHALLTSLSRAPTASSKRVPKTRVIYVVQGHYGHHGWEDVTAEETRKEALARLREYRENESAPFRLIRRREKIVTGAAHATRKTSSSRSSAHSTRAADLIASYGTWTSGYSNEDLDRASGLANRLTDIDRAEGRPAPPVGFSKTRYAQAKQVVEDANRYGAKQQALRARRQ